MRKHWISGGLLAAGVLVVFGVAALSGGSPPAASAQTPDDCELETESCVLITKETDPEDDDPDFSFDVSGANEGDFELNSGETELLTTDINGVIEVSEEETEGWVLESIDCNDEQLVDVDVDEANATVTVDFSDLEAEGAVIECTFTNEEVPATATATATTTSTTVPTATATPIVTVAVNPTATRTTAPVATPTVTTGTISPPSTGSGGLK
jgi:hypothetical protein